MNESKLIISIYDYTGVWPSEYVKAGYPVILWDEQFEGDILAGFSRLLMYVEETGLNVYGILAACPCTDFASSGARWFAEKDKPEIGFYPFINTTDLSIALVEIVLHLVELVKPFFWSLENPVGRIEKLVPALKPFRRYSFDPCDFGDPYTKKTILWGKFNTSLKRTPVMPLFGSMMHNVSSGPNQKKIRSATPVGFAKAFFEANK